MHLLRIFALALVRRAGIRSLSDYSSQPRKVIRRTLPLMQRSANRHSKRRKREVHLHRAPLRPRPYAMRSGLFFCGLR